MQNTQGITLVWKGRKVTVESTELSERHSKWIKARAKKIKL